MLESTKCKPIIPPSAYFRPVQDPAPDAGFMIHVLLYILYIYTLVLIHKSKQAAPPLMTLPRPWYTPCSARLPSHVKQGCLHSIFRFFYWYESVAPWRLALHVVKRIGGPQPGASQSSLRANSPPPNISHFLSLHRLLLLSKYNVRLANEAVYGVPGWWGGMNGGPGPLATLRCCCWSGHLWRHWQHPDNSGAAAAVALKSPSQFLQDSLWTNNKSHSNSNSIL